MHLWQFGPEHRVHGGGTPFACNFGDTENPCEFTTCAGCTDPAACTYLEGATISITCLYPEDFFGVDYVDCAGDCLNDANANGLCDETEIVGCSNPLACNYVDGATFDDGSCDTTSCAGCTDAAACNYDATASFNDGSATTRPAADVPTRPPATTMQRPPATTVDDLPAERPGRLQRRLQQRQQCQRHLRRAGDAGLHGPECLQLRHRCHV